jgi:hypothetical protein
MTPDPIRGEVVGEYADAATAIYYETLRNSHLDDHYALNEFEHMYQSEIDFVLVGLWDGGIDWYLGNGPNADAMIFDAIERNLRGNEPTLVEALVAMTNAARHAYPDSVYARGRPTDITLVPAYKTLHGRIFRAETILPGFTLEHTPTSDPYESQWTCSPPNSDVVYGGSTPGEAIEFMLSEETNDLG